MAEGAVALAAVSAVGNVKANLDQAKAERENAAYFREQAKFIEESTQRELYIFESEAADVKAEQAGIFAKQGIAFEGSALLALQQTDFEAIMEMNAIRKDSEFRKRLAILRAEQSESRAENLTSPLNLLLSAGGPAAQGAVNYNQIRASERRGGRRSA